MTNFVYDNTSLPATKSDFTSRPDVPPTQKIVSADWNTVSQALYDIQSVFRGGLKVYKTGDGTKHCDLKVYNGSPNGALASEIGSLCIDITDVALYQNTDGNTAWSQIGALNQPIQNLVLTPAATPSSLGSGNTNDYNPTSWSNTTVFRVTPNAAGSTVTGFTAQVDGTIRYIANIGTAPLFLTNEDSNSLAANRINTPGLVTAVIVPNDTATLRYDATSSRWFLQASPDNANPLLLDPQWQLTGPVTLASGLTSNWDPYAGSPIKTAVVLVTPNSADSSIDGMLADGSGTAPINGAVRILVHSAANHGRILVKNFEGSASTAANCFDINSEQNVSGSGFAIGYRQAAIFVYNSNISRWQCIGGLDGHIGKLGLAGDITDAALANGTVNNYSPTGIQYTSRLRLTSLGTTTLTGILAQSHGDTLWLTNLASTALTLSHSDAGSLAANRFLCPNAVSAVLPQYGTALLVYDNTLTSWIVIACISGTGTANTIAKWTGTAALGNSLITDNGTTVTVAAKLSVTNSGGTTLTGQYTYVGRQVLSATSGTYTPSTGVRGAIVRMTGPGGGGGGAAGGANIAVGAGGNSGQWVETHVGFAGSTITGGAFACPAGGAGGNTSGTSGATPSDTTLVINGSTLTAKGGVGGPGLTSTAPPFVWPASVGTVSTTGDYNGYTLGGTGIASSAGSGQGGNGGSGPYGGGGLGTFAATGGNATGFGAGGGGAGAQATGKAGGSGSGGLIIIDEYI